MNLLLCFTVILSITLAVNGAPQESRETWSAETDDVSREVQGYYNAPVGQARSPSQPVQNPSPVDPNPAGRAPPQPISPNPAPAPAPVAPARATQPINPNPAPAPAPAAPAKTRTWILPSQGFIPYSIAGPSAVNVFSPFVASSAFVQPVWRQDPYFAPFPMTYY